MAMLNNQMISTKHVYDMMTGWLNGRNEGFLTCPTSWMTVKNGNSYKL